MNIATALQIVLDLAEQNVIMDPEMGDEYQKQMDAIRLVEEFAENLPAKE